MHVVETPPHVVEAQDRRAPVAHLAIANSLRFERARLFRHLEAGALDPGALAAEPPECLRNTFIFDFLMRVPRFGPVRIKELNGRAVRAQINLATTLGGLSTMRRQWLVGQLQRRGVAPVATGYWPLNGRPQG